MFPLNKNLLSLGVGSSSPLKQQLDEGTGGGEGPVSGEEYTGEVGLLVLWVQQVGDQSLKGGGLQPAHLHRVVLDEAECSGQLCRVQAGKDRLSAQRDAKHSPILLLLPPLLHWVLQEQMQGHQDVASKNTKTQYDFLFCFLLHNSVSNSDYKILFKCHIMEKHLITELYKENILKTCTFFPPNNLNLCKNTHCRNETK